MKQKVLFRYKVRMTKDDLVIHAKMESDFYKGKEWIYII